MIKRRIGEWVSYDLLYPLYLELESEYAKKVENVIERHKMSLSQNEYDALFFMVYNRPVLADAGHALDKFYSGNERSKSKFIKMLTEEYQTLSLWSSHGEGWINRIKNCAEVYFDNNYEKKY